MLLLSYLLFMYKADHSLYDGSFRCNWPGNICVGVVRVLEANIQGCGYEILWRSRITFVLQCAKPA